MLVLWVASKLREMTVSSFSNDLAIQIDLLSRGKCSFCIQAKVQREVTTYNETVQVVMNNFTKSPEVIVALVCKLTVEIKNKNFQESLDA